MTTTASVSADAKSLSEGLDSTEFWRRFPDALKNVNFQFLFGAESQPDRPKKTRKVHDETSSTVSELHSFADLNDSKAALQHAVNASTLSATLLPPLPLAFPSSYTDSDSPTLLDEYLGSGTVGPAQAGSCPVQIVRFHPSKADAVCAPQGMHQAWEWEMRSDGREQEAGKLNSCLQGSPCVPEPCLELPPGMAPLSDSDTDNSPLLVEGDIDSLLRPEPFSSAAVSCGGQGDVQEVCILPGSSQEEEESWLQALDFLQDGGAAAPCLSQDPGFDGSDVSRVATEQQVGQVAQFLGPAALHGPAVGAPARAVCPGPSLEYFNAEDWLQTDTWQSADECCDNSAAQQSERASVSTDQESCPPSSVSPATSAGRDPFTESWVALGRLPLPPASSASAASEDDSRKKIVSSQKRCHSPAVARKLTVSDQFQRPPDLTARLANIVHSKVGGGQWQPASSLQLADDMRFRPGTDNAGRRPAASEKPFPFNQLPKGMAIESPRMMPLANCESTPSSTPEEVRRRLLAYAEALATDDQLRARILLGRLQMEANTEGTCMQRVAAYFLQGLQTRAAGTAVEHYRKNDISDEEVCEAIEEYSFRIPVFHASIKGCVYTIADALVGAKKVHIVDFSVWQGGQWLPLLRRLGARPGPKPRVRITVLNLNNPMQTGCRRVYFCDQAEVMKTLVPCAREHGITLEFETVRTTIDALTPDVLGLRPDEVLAVCCAFRLQNVSDQAVGTRMSRRDYILECIRQLNPRVVAIADAEVDLNTDFYLQRLARALDFYSAHFNAIERAYPPPSSRPRANYEEFFLGRDFVNAVAGEGTLRVHRPESAARTAARMLRLGFWRHPVSADVLPTIRGFMPRFACGWTIEDAPGQLRVLWMGRPLSSVTVWRNGRPPEHALELGGLPLAGDGGAQCCPCAICAQQRETARLLA